MVVRIQSRSDAIRDDSSLGDYNLVGEREKKLAILAEFGAQSIGAGVNAAKQDYSSMVYRLSNMHERSLVHGNYLDDFLHDNINQFVRRNGRLFREIEKPGIPDGRMLLGFVSLSRSGELRASTLTGTHTSFGVESGAGEASAQMKISGEKEAKRAKTNENARGVVGIQLEVAALQLFKRHEELGFELFDVMR